MKKSLRRAVSLEYAVVLMAVVLVFAALLIALSSYSFARADDYGEYLSRKQFLDEVGESFLDGETDLASAYADGLSEHSLTLTQDETQLVISRLRSDGTAGAAVLTVVTKGETRTCIRYVYGKL